jgi:NAD(P)-dependent dehydrogenase (short-subunit alcohol dehydrogenase family)
MKQVIVITGGGSGLGMACALELGKTGYTILISGTNDKKLRLAKEKLETAGINCYCHKCDVSKKDDVDNLLKYARTLGEIWAVINAAGVAPPRVKDEKSIIDINAMGVFNVSEAFLKEMKKGGAIINVASICAYEIPRLLRPKRIYHLVESKPDRCEKKMARLSRIFGKKHAPNIAYAISKCFVIYYSKKAAKRFYEENEIRILSISPSNFLTEMGKADIDERPDSVQKYFEKQAVEKSGDPADLAFLVKCLIDERMRLLTASDIHLDGGWHGYNKGKVRW